MVKRNSSTPAASGSAALAAIASRNVAPIGESKSKRKKWSRELNLDVMKAYYQASELCKNTTNMRKTFLSIWNGLHPEIEVSEGNLCDRRRYLVTNKIFTEGELLILRNNVKSELNQPGNANGDEINSTKSNNTTVEVGESAVEDNGRGLDSADGRDNDGEEERFRSIVQDELQTVIRQYRFSDPLARPRLGKVSYSGIVTKVLKLVNELILPYMSEQDTIQDTHALLYCMALTSKNAACILVLRKVNNVHKDSTSKVTDGVLKKGCCGIRNKNKQWTFQPAWKKRLETKIAKTRSILTKLNNWNANAKYKKTREILHYLAKQNLHVKDTQRIQVHIQNLKQKILAWGARLRRYNLSLKRKRQNKLFQYNQKKFYTELEPNLDSGERNLPQVKILEQFWGGLWKHGGDHNEEAEWLRTEREECVGLSDMNDITVSSRGLQSVLRKLHNWKAPGPDGIQNFWWKKMTSLHPAIVRHITGILSNPQEVPDFLMRGTTYMIYKGGGHENPKNYRPITCLNTFYKIITSFVTRQVVTHLERNGILSEEQKGCKSGSMGCKEQLLIDSVIMVQSKKRNRNLSVAWVDYQKAYDSVPHSWLLEVLRLYKIHPGILGLMTRCMGAWKTELRVAGAASSALSAVLVIERGLFQGDAFSPVWFCMALNPLSRLLNRSMIGYRLIPGDIRSMVTHLLYMDDLKLYASNAKNRDILLDNVNNFSDDIKMVVGVTKCARLDIIRGKIQEASNPDTKPIGYLAGHYKYLGFRQDQTFARDTKEVLKATFFQRVKKLLKTKLNAKNLISAINCWAIPVLLYSFGIVKWSNTEIEDTNRKVRVMLTKQGYHHPKAALERLYLPRKEGGRGLLDLKHMMDRQIFSLKAYFQGRTNTSSMHYYVSKCDLNYTPLNLEMDENNAPNGCIAEKKSKWENKVLHGRFANALSQSNKEHSTMWLRNGELFPETEGFMVAIQDEAIATRNHRKHIMKQQIEDVCRLCGQNGETIQHLSSGCSQLASTEYLRRHNLTCNILHQHFAEIYKLTPDNIKLPHYKYNPDPITENEQFLMFYDCPIITDKTIRCNRPDVVVVDKMKREAIMFDVSHPLDNNMERAAKERITRYHDLAMEFKRIRKLTKVEIIPIIISSNGLVPKSLPKYCDDCSIPLPLVYKMQKSVILETCRIIRTYLRLEDDR